jgi:stress response protein SCP2
MPAYLAPYAASFTNAQYMNSMSTIYIPDAIAIGLGWEGSQNSHSNVDLLASVFDSQNNNLGYLGGWNSNNRTLFDNAIYHTGDDVSGGQSNRVSSVLGDNENIVFDLARVPPHVSTIFFGITLVSNVPVQKAYCHMLPLMREENVNANLEPPTAREADSDSDSGSDSDSDSDSDKDSKKQKKSPRPNTTGGTRGVNDSPSSSSASLSSDSYSASASTSKHDFLTLFFADLDQYPDFFAKKGFVAGKIFRDPTGSWQFSPIRQVINIDPTYGIWPHLESYAKQNSTSIVQQQPNSQYTSTSYQDTQYGSRGILQPQQQQQQYYSGQYPPYQGY